MVWQVILVGGGTLSLLWSSLDDLFSEVLRFDCFTMERLTGCRLYILEGVITVIWAGACVFLVPKDYETAYFLTPDEKIMMRERARRAESYSGGSGHYTKRDIQLAAKDIKSWSHGLIQICVVTVLYGLTKLMRWNIRTLTGIRFRNVLAHHHQEWFPLLNRSSTISCYPW